MRSYQFADHQSVTWLYQHGLLRDQLATNDTGLDIDNIQAAYLDDPRHHFWVAECQGSVRGMIGVASEDDNTAEIRRLRVHPEYHHSPVPHRLLETALNHCTRHNYLKVLLDTHFEPQVAVALFDEVGFQHARTRTIQGKDVLEFYLDIYRQRPELDERRA